MTTSETLADSPTVADSKACTAPTVVVAFVATAIVIVITASLTIVYAGGLFHFQAELDRVGASSADNVAMEKALNAAYRKNAILGVTIVGSLMAGCFAFTTAMLSGTKHRIGLRALTGFFVGAVFGFIGAIVETWVFDLLAQQDAIDSLVKGIIGHAIGWGAIAVAVGFACSLASDGRLGFARAFGATATGALLGAMIYPPLGSVLFPIDKAETVLPTGSLNQVAWIALTTLLIGVFLGLKLGGQKQTTTES